MKFVAVTSCPTGIAHTYMAADALTQTAGERDDVAGEWIRGDAEDGAPRQRAAGDAADPGGILDDERRATRLRPYEIERQPGIGDESRHGIGAGREGLGAEVDVDARDPTAAEEAAELVGRFEQHDAHAGAREIVGDRETRDAASDHDDVDRLRFIATATFMLAGLSFVAVIFTAAPALMLTDCR